MNNEKFNFDEMINRRDTHSVKWDQCPSDDVIPMWIADMDFKAAPCIMDALKKRLEHGVFGYANVPNSISLSSTGLSDATTGQSSKTGLSTPLAWFQQSRR